jgi:hypothetical protein
LRGPAYFFFAPTRLALLMASGGRPDLAVLFENVAVCGPVTIQPAEQFRGHAPVGTLRPILIETSKKAYSPLGLVPGFFGMSGLSSICVPLSKKKDRRRPEEQLTCRR